MAFHPPGGHGGRNGEVMTPPATAPSELIPGGGGLRLRLRLPPFLEAARRQARVIALSPQGAEGGEPRERGGGAALVHALMMRGVHMMLVCGEHHRQMMR